MASVMQQEPGACELIEDSEAPGGNIGSEAENKVFVAGRVTWTGAGINFKTSCPTAEQVRDAVREVLKGDSYRASALKRRRNFVEYRPSTASAGNLEPFLAGPNIMNRNDRVPARSAQSLMKGETQTRFDPEVRI